ncbi:MAG: phosphatidylglycerophosphatase A [Betaproteobacteria bacterium]|nr:phosphatidylglycerophosphatase A [Betaproteobacteria bacterium]
MILRPTFRFVFSHPAHFLSFGFGIGLIRFAPGTFGTLLALPLYWYALREYAPGQALLIIGALFAVGVWACSITGRNLGVADHGSMVWDEVVAFLLILLIAPEEPGWQAAAFFLFRAFDVVKPSPIREFERRVKGGLGVMADDILAAGYTLLVLAIARRIFY